MRKDVFIIGGGVIGCSLALRLAEAGLSVAVAERARIGAEASRAAAGMLSPQAEALQPGPLFDLCLRSRALYRDFAAHLKERSGIDIEYRDEGTLVVALSPRDQDEIHHWSSWQRQAGLPLAELSAEEVRRLEPSVSESALGAVFLPEDHQVENRRLMDALDQAMRRAGVEVLEGIEATSLLTTGGRVTGVACGEVHLSAGAVVLAAGSWSKRLAEPLGLRVPTVPARGQMLALRGGPAIEHVLHSCRIYIVPRRDGRILLGATVEYAGFDKSNTVGGVHGLLASAVELVPGLANAGIVESWAGLRPDTPDHLPILGPSGIDNLFLATGHFRNGILLAPASAELLAQCIIEGRAPEALRPFSIARFA